MSYLICPVCSKDLRVNETSYFCENKHLFDRAKSGYVNLYLNQQGKDHQHGDDKQMIRARRDFLDQDYYKPLLSAVCKAISVIAENDCRILDAGCGECYYTAHVFEYLLVTGIKPEILGIDISKDALKVGAKRCPHIELAVASVFHLPVKDESYDILLSIFAPFGPEEFHRVIKTNGVMIRVIPLERHLFSLKKAVYDAPYENPIEHPEVDGFSLIDRREIRETICLRRKEDILNVFTMTPYYYKTSQDDKRKLEGLSALDTEIEFGILTYRKK
ncbi:MAG: methyltransferase domain-containing protein [Clostridiales bacterium]|nr:methyltransferase domain-containing protein [Clostridiales bacterium]